MPVFKDIELKDPSLFITEGYINGSFAAAKSGKTFPVTEPSSEEVLGQVADFSLEEFQDALKSSEAAFKTYYKSTTAAERGKLLRKWYELTIANVDDLATILSLENGKTLAEAKGEVEYAASFISWFSEEATRAYGDVIPAAAPNTTILAIKQPIGVCGIITPWNFPAAMITRKIAPALGVGCTVVIKPPSETPYTALALTKLAYEAGFPANTIQVLPTRDRKAASELAVNPIVRKLSFTGSTGVGKMLTALAAQTMKRVSMELGGNAPFIVFKDADIDSAVEGCMASKFRGTGQTCVCVNRIYVHSAVAKEFTEKLVAAVQKLTLGFGLDPKTTQGPLVNAGGVKKVEEHIQDAVSKGGKIEFGGKRPEGKGFFIEPTVISGVTKEMVVANDETFGPLAPIFQFDTEEEVLEQANATEFGLAGYFFSRDINTIWRVATSLECGMIGVNTGKISAAEAPFGGVKESGVGREGSKYGQSEYLVIKNVTIGNLQL